MPSTKWCVWGPELYGSRMVVQEELTQEEAVAAAERKNAAAKRFGAKGGYQAAKEGDPAPELEEEPDRYDVRKDPELSYQAFMSMGREEWNGAITSILNGGVFEPAEDIGFRKALKERGLQ